MKLRLVRIQPRRRLASPADALYADFVARCGRYEPTEAQDLPSEADLVALLERSARRTAPVLVLTDSQGQQVSSPEFAQRLGDFADRGTQEVILAIGPADGWSPAMRARAALTIAFGRITLPHELAAVVLAEQTYRALTIRAGHPYHSGHG